MVNTQFHIFYGRSFERVLYLILMRLLEIILHMSIDVHVDSTAVPGTCYFVCEGSLQLAWYSRK